MKGAIDQTMEPGKLRFIEKLGLYYENYGIPRIGGKIIGLLIAAGRPVSAEEMAKQLSVSRSSVSTNVRLLLMAGFVEVAPQQGSRTDYFTLAANAWDNAIHARIEGFRNLKAIVEQGIAALEDNNDEALTQLQEMACWTDVMIDGHEKILVEWENAKQGS